jgi:hypothetical protein
MEKEMKTSATRSSGKKAGTACGGPLFFSSGAPAAAMIISNLQCTADCPLQMRNAENQTRRRVSHVS